MSKADAPFTVSETAPVSVSDDALGRVEHKPGPVPGSVWINKNTIRLTLLDPVTLSFSDRHGASAETLEYLDFHKLKGREMQAMLGESDSASRNMFLFTASLKKIGAIGEAIVNELDARDWQKASKIVGVFTESGR